jgi:hypothetical protein
MNDAEIHLIINHLPVMGAIFGSLTLAVAMLAKNEGAIRTGLIFIVIAGIASIPAVQSGEGAEDIIEEIRPSEDIHDLIHEHEEQGETAQWLGLASAALALISLYFRIQKRGLSRLFTGITLVIALVTAGFFGSVAHSGGLISHPELHENFELPE